MSDITSHYSQTAVLHFSCSNRNILEHSYVNMLNLFRLPNKEHQLIFWRKESLEK